MVAMSDSSCVRPQATSPESGSRRKCMGWTVGLVSVNVSQHRAPAHELGPLNFREGFPSFLKTPPTQRLLSSVKLTEI